MTYLQYCQKKPLQMAALTSAASTMNGKFPGLGDKFTQYTAMLLAYARPRGGLSYQDVLFDAFDWRQTAEGGRFWNMVYYQSWHILLEKFQETLEEMDSSTSAETLLI